MLRRRLGFNRTLVTVAAVISIACPLLLSLPRASRAQDQSQGAEADAKAIQQVFAEFYESFSRHDAHGIAMTFAEDADFTNMRGAHQHGRKEIEAHFTMVFAGNLKAARRTDIVKGVRFLTPDLASVDADTVISGTLAADGTEGPPRKGLMITTMTKQKGRWLISVFHEVEFPPAPER